MNYSKLVLNDIANGPGIRTTLFVSGCTHHCKGCFQPETWNFTNGLPFTSNIIDAIILHSKKNQFVKGLSLLGGDPFDNIEGVLELSKRYKETFKNEKTIWLWTGYTYEEIIKDKEKMKLLEYIDVLIDGKFVEEEKDLMLKYKGSRNQRVIDMKRTRTLCKISLVDDTED